MPYVTEAEYKQLKEEMPELRRKLRCCRDRVTVLEAGGTPPTPTPPPSPSPTPPPSLPPVTPSPSPSPNPTPSPSPSPSPSPPPQTGLFLNGNNIAPLSGTVTNPVTLI